jgi:hypothetical protein
VIQPDLLQLLTPECGDCPNLGEPINSGIRYCHGFLVWRWATDRIEACPYRAAAVRRNVFAVAA